ncbi:MAG: hydroxymethylbilane synthase [Opitutales bacterium]
MASPDLAQRRKLVLATRKSRLALVQTELVAEALRKACPDKQVEPLKLVTSGDARKGWSLEQKGGKGLFTKELEDALLDGRADAAIHSAKDLPTEMDDRLEVAGFLPRAPVADVLVYREDTPVPQALATSSPRRRQQAKHLFPNAVWCEIRGNVETRLRKIQGGHADGTILAEAGLTRLGIMPPEGLKFRTIPMRCMVPAAGQGAIAVQCRAGEAAFFEPILCPDTARAVRLERAFLARMGGGCQIAMGVHYSGSVLDIYHEDWGHHTFNVPTEKAEAVDETVDHYLETIRKTLKR